MIDGSARFVKNSCFFAPQVVSLSRKVRYMNSQPVGVFDSGVGGISVLASLMRELPQERFFYYGDTAHAPYGTKPTEEVNRLVGDVTRHLIGEGIKALVIACNTASAVSAQTLRETYSFPIVAMEPALKPASLLRRDGRVLVLATPVTLALPKFGRLMAHYGEGAERVPCPGLMELVEREDWDGAETYLRELFARYDGQPIDAVVLGCTHYVFLRPIARRLLPETTAIVDGNEGTARQLRHVLEERQLLSGAAVGGYALETSGDPAVTLPVMERLLRLGRQNLTAD